MEALANAQEAYLVLLAASCTHLHFESQLCESLFLKVWQGKKMLEGEI